MLGTRMLKSDVSTAFVIRSPMAGMMMRVGWPAVVLGSTSPGTAVPRIVTGGGRRTGPGSGASVSAWSPVRAQAVLERSRKAKAGQGGTTPPSRSEPAERTSTCI